MSKSDQTRRSFLLAGATGALLPGSALEADPRQGGSDAATSLDGLWLFRLDPGAEGESAAWFRSGAPLAGWRAVEVPHTWQVEPANTEYRGLAWYRRTFDVPAAWSDRAVRIEFEAVFHTATVWVNGREAGRHVGKGYTAFALDIGPLLEYGAVNSVAVLVDNAFNEFMLPRGRSSDWARDGGIYRPVQLLVTPKIFLERIAVDADPDLASRTATIGGAVTVRNTSAAAWNGTIDYHVSDEETGGSVEVRLGPGEVKTVPLGAATLRDPRLWHFDHPHLYRFIASIRGGHSLETTFGIRKIEIRDAGFYLNGERVRLMGVERMAGSNPEFGMAEPVEWIEHDLADMKELNSVYTRVHWPQDRAVLDWCDGHGMLIQTEVPTWGPATFRDAAPEAPAEIMNNGLEQLREMIDRDRNHPCIFSWGLCNEIGGQNPPAYAFARRMYQEAKRLDPMRLATYASNSLFATPAKDVAGLMDYVMMNEYVGTWQRGHVEDLSRYLVEVHRAFPEKPLVISEYGYCACTPDRPEGDAERIAVLREHDKVFRQRDYIGGLIFFCYNDYRTHIGDRGTGALRQRVHGVVDVYGRRKPSYDVLRRESSPIETLEVSGQAGELKVHLVVRSAVPTYTLRAYKLRTLVYGQGDIPVERVETALADLTPGEQASFVVAFSEASPVRVELDVLRPTGSSVHSLVWRP